ncbi:MAG: MgtC/SapB family protein [Chloroflexota bacterium]
MELTPTHLLQLGLAVLVGGLIGAEREFRDKAAGFRTIIFITLGATLFTIISLQIGIESNPTRIAANIVTGIGFLGAGAIMRDGTKVGGLTTAATIWLAAALGMGIGAGKYLLVGAATAAILSVLWVFPAIEGQIDRIRENRTYVIQTANTDTHIQKLAEIFTACGLRVYHTKFARTGDRVKTTWHVNGKLSHHEALVKTLLANEDVEEFTY